MIAARAAWIVLPLAAIALLAAAGRATLPEPTFPLPPDRREPVFDLLLDPAGNRLDLRLDGFLLRSFEVSRASVQVPQLLFLPRPSPSPGSLGGFWSGARLSPAGLAERTEIEPGMAEENMPLPPSAEELPAPSRFTIAFEQGGSIEFVAAAPQGLLQRAFTRLAEVGNALTGAASGRPRLRLEMPTAEAAALYRSFPIDVRFRVLPPSRGD